ncbi:hypothetical protein MMPV_001198 [Pyropia vietnamensis]
MNKKVPPQLVRVAPVPTAAVAVAFASASAAALAAALTDGGGAASWAAVAIAAIATAILTTVVWPHIATDMLGLHGASLPTPVDGRDWPLLGRVPQVVVASHDKVLSHQYVAWQRLVGWGVNYQIYFFGRRHVVLANAEDVRAVTVRADAPRDRGMLRHFGTALSPDILFLVSEPRHGTARRLVHSFLSGTPTTETVLRMVNESLWGVHPQTAGANNARGAAAAPSSRWATHFEALADSGEPVDIDGLMTDVTVDVIHNLLYSVSPSMADLASKKEWMFRLIDDLTKLVGLPLPELLGASCMASMHATGDRFLEEFEALEARRRASYANGSAASPPRDLLDIMIADLDKGKSGVYEGDRRRVAADLMFYLLAGYDTTAHSIAWTVHALLDDPKSEARLVAELDATLPPAGEPITAAHLAAMPYADAVWKESLRLFPPASSGTIRRLEADLRLPSSGDVIPGGTVIMIPVLPAHRNPKVFPSPEKYDPARWLPPTAPGGGGYTPAEQRMARSHFMAFSSGPRACTGQNMAAVEAKAVLAVLFHRYRFERVGKTEDVVLENSVTMRPAGLRVILHRRAVGA